MNKLTKRCNPSEHGGSHGYTSSRSYFTVAWSYC